MVSWQGDDYELRPDIVAVAVRAAEAYRSATPTPNIMSSKEYGIGGGPQQAALASVARAYSLRHDWRVQHSQTQPTQAPAQASAQASTQAQTQTPAQAPVQGPDLVLGPAPTAPQGTASVQGATMAYKPSTVSNSIAGSGGSATRAVGVQHVAKPMSKPTSAPSGPSKPMVSVTGGMPPTSTVGVTRSVSAPMPPTPTPAPPPPAVVGPPVSKASCSELTARQMSYVQVPKANPNPSVLAQRPRGGQQPDLSTSAVEGTPRAPVLTRATRARAPAQSPPVKKVMSPNVVQAPQNNAGAPARPCFTSRCQTPMTDRRASGCTPARQGLPSTRFSSGHFSVPAPMQTPRPELEYRNEHRDAHSPAPPASTLVASQRSFPAQRSSPSRTRASSVPPVTAADYPLRECTPAQRRPHQPVMRQSSCHGFGPTGPDTSRDIDTRLEIATVGPPVKRPTVEFLTGSTSSRISVFAPPARPVHGHPATSSTSKPSFLASVGYQEHSSQPYCVSTPAGPVAQALSPLIAAQRFVYPNPGAVESAIQRSYAEREQRQSVGQVSASEASRETKMGKQLAVTFLHSPCSSVSSLPTLPPEPADDPSRGSTAQDEQADVHPITEKDLRILDLEAQVQQLEGERNRVDALEAAVKRLEGRQLHHPLQNGTIAAHGGTGTTTLAQEVQLETSPFVLNAVAEEDAAASNSQDSPVKAAEEDKQSLGTPSPTVTARGQEEAEAYTPQAPAGTLRQRVDCLAALVYSHAPWQDGPQLMAVGHHQWEADAATGGLRNLHSSIITDEGCTGSCVSPPIHHYSPRQQKHAPVRGSSSARLFESISLVEGHASPPSPSKPARVSITTKPW